MTTQLDLRNVLFVAAYVLRLPSPGLRAWEIAYTQGGIEHALTHGQWEWVSTDNINHYYDLPYAGLWAHPTAGKVGGFNYTITHDKHGYTAHCTDTWDFNPLLFRVQAEVRMPSYIGVPLQKALSRILPRFKWAENASITYAQGTLKASFIEEELMLLNEKHAFVTKWDVEIPDGLSCPIDLFENQDSDGYYSEWF